MEIKNKQDFEILVKSLDFKFAKTYAHFAPHEYSVTNERGTKLNNIRLLNKYIQEHFDIIETFYNRDYPVLFIGKYKYWSIEDWNLTNILNRNWDFINKDGTINKSITNKFLIKRSNDEKRT